MGVAGGEVGDASRFADLQGVVTGSLDVGGVRTVVDDAAGYAGDEGLGGANTAGEVSISHQKNSCEARYHLGFPLQLDGMLDKQGVWKFCQR